MSGGGDATALTVLIDVAIGREDWPRVAALCDELAASGRSFPFAPLYAALARGECARRQGNYPVALEHYQEVEPAARRVGSRIEAAVADIASAEALRALGDIAAASRCAYRAVEAVSRCGYVPELVWAHLRRRATRCPVGTRPPPRSSGARLPSDPYPRWPQASRTGHARCRHR